MSSPRYAGSHADVQRDCALYRVLVLDPRTNYRSVCLGYIGETAREPFVRFLEHLYDQPFGDTIVGQPQVDPRRFTSKAEVWAAEQAAVEAERPLYNYEWNLGNPDRVPIPEARRQREMRDAARGVPSPTWSTRPAVRGVRWRWAWSMPALMVWVWLVLAGFGWWLLGGPVPGAFGATVAVLTVLGEGKRRGRRPRRRR